MDKLDMKLLNLLQKGLTISDSPFDSLAESLEISPQEVLQRIKTMKESGYIRRIGGVFTTGKMGFTSILVGMEVSEDCVQDVVKVVNTFDGVTHNYYRKNRINVWFTLATRSLEDRKSILKSISELPGVKKIYELPTEKHFKLNVFFDMEGSSDV